MKPAFTTWSYQAAVQLCSSSWKSGDSSFDSSNITTSNVAAGASAVAWAPSFCTPKRAALLAQRKSGDGMTRVELKPHLSWESGTLIGPAVKANHSNVTLLK